MTAIKLVSANRVWATATFLLIAVPFASAKPQKKSTTSDQEKPEAILAAAKKVSETRAWRVDARIEANKQMNISGIVAVNDFDLTIETVDGTKRQITWATRVGSAMMAAKTGGMPT